MLSEIYVGKVNLKHPTQVKVIALTDNSGTWGNLHSSCQCDEKLLRNSVALINEMIDQSEVKRIDWVETNNMLADILTKKGGYSMWIKEVISRNTF